MRQIKIAGIIALLIAILSLLFGCGKAKEVIPSPVEGASIKYDGRSFTWEQPKNAEKYKVVVNENSEISVVSQRYDYTAKSSDDHVTFTIKSVSSTGNESEAIQKSFTRLATIQVADFQFDAMGVLTWPSVPDADQYIIEVNGTQKTIDTTSYSDFEKGRANRIRVRAITSDGSTFSDFSQMAEKFFLAAPSGIKYDGQTITWQGNPNASGGYEIYINGSLQGTSRTASFLFDSQNQSINISIRALGDQTSNPYAISSDISEEVRYIFLPLITDIHVNNGILEWENVEEATAYQVRINRNTIRTVNEPKFEVEPGVATTFEIKPIVSEGSNFFSSFSAEKQVFVLKAPQLRWNDAYDLSDGEARNNLSWAKISDNIIGYGVRLTFDDGTGERTIQIDDLGPNDNDFAYAFAEAGTYTIALKSNADTSTGIYYDSAYSTPITIVRLAAPKAAAELVKSNPTSLDEGFVINVQNVSGAIRYQVFKEGVRLDTVNSQTTAIRVPVTDIIENNSSEAADLSFQVQAIGGGSQTIGGRTQVTLSSLTRDNLNVDIHVRAMPRNIEFAGTKATWQAAVGASNGYSVKFSNIVPNPTNVFDFTSIQSGTYYFSVCTTGDGGNNLPSFFSDVYTIVRLEAPTAIRVGTSDNEDCLSWDPVPHAVSYQIYFNGGESPVAANSNDSIKEYITESGVTIDLIAVANVYDTDNNKTYYVSSPHMANPIQMIRLSRPTFGDQKVRNGYLVWNTPTNVDEIAYTSDYKIYDEAGYAYTGLYHSQQFNIYEKGCTEGAYNYFSIKAMGDGIRYLNSEMSDTVGFFLLATPEVSRVGDAYTWAKVPMSRSYRVEIEGELVKEITHENVSGDYASYPVDLSKFTSTNKEYTITVTAVGDDGYEIVSSKPFEYKQKVMMASTPEIAISYSEPQYNVNGQIIVTITKQSNYTKGYKFAVGGATSEEKTELEYRYVPNSIGTFQIYCYATGAQFDNDGVLYIASDRASTQMTLLAAPSNLNVNRDGYFEFRHTDSARSGFSYIVYYDDGRENVTGTTNVAFIQLTDFSHVTRVDIKAYGNGSTVIDSEYATWNKK